MVYIKSMDKRYVVTEKGNDTKYLKSDECHDERESPFSFDLKETNIYFTKDGAETRIKEYLKLLYAPPELKVAMIKV